MNYTDSADFATNVGTGHKLHQDTAPATTVWSAKDANMVIWSLMKLIEGASISAANFDPNTPATYNRVLLAVQAIAAAAGSGGTLQTQGTFTPALRFGGASTGITYASPVGSWVKRGKQTDFWVSMALTSKGSATGDATIILTGLANSAITCPCQASVDLLTGLTGHVSGFLTAGANVVELRNFNASSGSEATVATNANFTNTSVVYLRGSYLEP